MVNRRYTHPTNTTISSILIDQINKFTWIGFDKDTSSVCHLKRVSSFDLEQIYYDISLSVESINAMTILNGFLYIAIDGSEFVYKYSTTNPLTSNTTFPVPAGIVEEAIDIINDGTYIYVLTAGSLSGQNATIIQLDEDGVLVDTIDLVKSGVTITNAVSFTLDSNSEIRLITSNNPTELVRVYQLSGGVWTFDVN